METLRFVLVSGWMRRGGHVCRPPKALPSSQRLGPEDQTLLKELRQLGQASALRRQLAEELESLRSQAAALRHEARRFEDCATELQREVQALLS